MLSFYWRNGKTNREYGRGTVNFWIPFGEWEYEVSLKLRIALAFNRNRWWLEKNKTIWLVVNLGCLRTLKFDFIPGLIYLEASACPAAAVCPVVRMLFRAAQGCSYCNMYVHSFSDTRSFQKCSVCSFFICEQMFFSRVGRQREIYWKTTWMDFKTVVFFSPAHICWAPVDKSQCWKDLVCHPFHPPGTAACGVFWKSHFYFILGSLLGNSLVMVKVAVSKNLILFIT